MTKKFIPEEPSRENVSMLRYGNTTKFYFNNFKTMSQTEIARATGVSPRCSLCGKPLNREPDPHQSCVNYEKYLADRQKPQDEERKEKK